MLIVCCGMPRSGSTLQFNIVWKLAEAAGAGRRLEWRSATAWEQSGDELAAMAEDSALHVVKMHFPPGTVANLAQQSPDRVRFIYVHRDIRDVVVSMKVKFNFTLNRAIRRISESLQLEQWLAERPKSSLLVQDYEKLLRSLPDAVAEVAEFLNVSVPSETIRQISDELDIAVAFQRSRTKRPAFEHLRRRINRLLGRKVTFADDELMLHPQHVSAHKGEIGIWKGSLSPKEIFVIEQNFGNRIRSGFHV